MVPLTPPLAGKVALVTGGSRGIGRAAAVALVRVGASVAVNYKTHAADAEAVCDEIRGMGGQAITVLADVSITGQTINVNGGWWPRWAWPRTSS
jgi:3-oxoacyl-[acyl-carrier protein] reductase